MHKLSELRPQIEVIESKNHYTAYCPICGDLREADVLTSEKTAKIWALGKIVTHLKIDHKNEVENDME